MGLVRLVRLLVWIGYNHLLLVQDPKKESPLLWQLPGGGVGRWESFADAAIRQCQEETGVPVELRDLHLRFCLDSRASTEVPTSGKVIGRNRVCLYEVLLPKTTCVPLEGSTGEKTGVFSKVDVERRKIPLVLEHRGLLNEVGFFDGFDRPMTTLKRSPD